MSLFRPERRVANLESFGIEPRSRRSRTPAYTEDRALRHGAVFACVDLVAELVSTLPVDLFRSTSDGRTFELAPVPLLIDPAGDGTGFEVWARQVMASLLMRGNAYGLITAVGQDGWPKQVETIHPDLVTATRSMTMGPIEWKIDGTPVNRWPAGPLWHLPAYTLPGSPVGLAPLRYAAETIGLGLSVQQFGSDWFADGAHPTAVLESDAQITQEQARAIKDRVLGVLANSREPLVLGAGLKFQPLTIAPEQSQFIEATRASVADVARYFRVPPEMIGAESGNSMTYANVEQRGLSLLTYTVNPWLVRLERALSRMRPAGQYVRFNPDALIRVDLKARYEAHAIAIDKWMTTNEIRDIEDRNPLPGGDSLRADEPPPAPAEEDTDD